MTEHELQELLVSTNSKVQSLHEKLYGINGFEGDIPELKRVLPVITRNTGRLDLVENNQKWVKWLAGLAAAGGGAGAAALVKSLFGG
uniref:Uncharacterized protein n=2 Tax=viral metagenome TaxID=1070528 RepID=A0A6M3XI40_9ZZZZ